MRLSEFRRAIAQEFGDGYGPVLCRDQWVGGLGGTVDEALLRGVSARDAWDALCEEMAVPAERRYGRGLVDPAR